MWMVDYSELSGRELEALQQQIGKNGDPLRVFIADIILPEKLDEVEKQQREENLEDRMRELENLVTTYGGVVILQHIQKRGVPDYNTYIGSGKLEEIMHEMHLQGANLLILGNILKPHQIYKLNDKLKTIGAVAWDRVDLILKIFEKNARTEETKLQIELAAIKHMGPRIFGMGMELSRQGGWSKLARGKGETNTEIMKRHLADREKDIRKKLENYSKVRENHRQGRKKKWFLTAGIVGYTNAGKSSLLNALTNKWTLAENKLFATLGTSVWNLWIESPSQKEGEYTPGTQVLLSDTIGFIRNLPPELIDAFASTLEDSIESDILLHVVDAGDPKIDEKIQVVEEILERIGAHQNRVLVLNKIDVLKKKEQKALYKKFSSAYQDILMISTYSWEGLENVKEYLQKIAA